MLWPPSVRHSDGRRLYPSNAATHGITQMLWSMIYSRRTFVSQERKSAKQVSPQKRSARKPLKPPALKRATVAQERVAAQREALLHRLARLHATGRKGRGYRTAIMLLTGNFLVASQATQIALLQAASFMVDVLERLPPPT
jgi:hypothetical protein